MIHRYLKTQTAKWLIAALILIGLLFSYDLAAANEPDVRGAIKISDNAALFFVSFTLNSAKGDMLVPITTKRTTSDAHDPTNTHYYIKNGDDDVIEGGQSNALLLSDEATYEDGQYRIEQGSSATFTLLAAYTNEAGINGHRLQIRTLPFEIENVLSDQQYNRHELGKFSSVSISISKSE